MSGVIHLGIGLSGSSRRAHPTLLMDEGDLRGDAGEEVAGRS